MTQEDHCKLVLAFARVLYVNGQGTELSLAAAHRLAAALGLPARISLRWGELELQLEDGGRPVWHVAASPVVVDMTRVASAMRAIDDLEGGRLAPDAAMTAIETISRSPARPAWIVSLAAGAGAVAMAAIFGVQHLVDAGAIFVSAAAGGLLRRGLARTTANALVQPFCASLMAGVLAALASRYQLVWSLRFVALCPCVILIPGAHVLNGLADLLGGRIPLGVARLVHAGLIIAAITTGLLLGLAVFGVALPLDDTVRAVRLWEHMAAAAVAITAFSIFFAMPAGLLPWPVVVGTAAQALRWAALAMGLSAAAGALVASLAIGMILIPVARQRRVPFAAIGFVAVVPMIPGAYLFTMASGLVQIARGRDTSLELIGAIIASGTTAMLIVLAICLGLIIPKLTMDYLEVRRRRSDERSPAS